MQFITERVCFDSEALTVVFPFSKKDLFLNKLRMFLKLKTDYSKIEKFIILNGGYVKDPF